MGQGYTRNGGGGRGRGNTGHHFAWDSRAKQGGQLLATATKNKRIPALQTHDPPAGTGVAQQEFDDLFLLCTMLAAAFTDRVQRAASSTMLQQVSAYQVVINHDLGCLQKIEAAYRNQINRARPGSNKRYKTLWLR